MSKILARMFQFTFSIPSCPESWILNPASCILHPASWILNPQYWLHLSGWTAWLHLDLQLIQHLGCECLLRFEIRIYIWRFAALVSSGEDVNPSWLFQGVLFWALGILCVPWKRVPASWFVPPNKNWSTCISSGDLLGFCSQSQNMVGGLEHLLFSIYWG